MRRAVVHIGIHKTGTTTIQKTLFSARAKLLSDARILYPFTHRNQSIHLGTMFLDEPPENLRMRGVDAADEGSVARLRERFRASLETDLAAADWHTLVISGERLCLFDSKGVERLTKWLSGYVGTITVVAFVRHPLDWTRSAVQQRLKAGQTLGHLYENIPLPEWREKFTPWLDAVGLEGFQLLSFDDARENEGIVAAFCEAAGLPYETVRSFASDVPTANESMSLEAVLLLDSLNRQVPLFVDGELSPTRRRFAQRYGIDAIRSVPGNKFYMDAEHEERVRADSRDDLAWLNATFGQDLFPDVFDDAPIEMPSRPSTMPQATVDALAIMLSELFGKEAQVEDLRRGLKRLRGQLERRQADEDPGHQLNYRNLN